MKKILLGLSVFFVTLSSAQNYPDYYPSNTTNNDYYGDAEDAAGKKIDAYSTTDFVVSYDFENGIGIIAGVNNIFNEKYNTYQSTSTSTGVTEYKPADEINYYVGVRYAF